jgi:hypothetical protein
VTVEAMGLVPAISPLADVDEHLKRVDDTSAAASTFRPQKPRRPHDQRRGLYGDTVEARV